MLAFSYRRHRMHGAMVAKVPCRKWRHRDRNGSKAIRVRHALILALMFACAVAIELGFDLPPLPAALLFILVVAIPVVFLVGVVRQMSSALLGEGAAPAKRRKQWIRGGLLFLTGALAIAFTQPVLGANSPDAIILIYGLGVVTVLASYLLLVPLAVEFIADLTSRSSN